MAKKIKTSEPVAIATPAEAPRAQAPKWQTDRETKFPRHILVAAQHSQRLSGMPASITLAQWAEETGFGKRMPEGSFNCFGIKAVGDQPFVLAPTGEVINGKHVTITARFRKFGSLDEAFAAHAELIMQGKPYRAAVADWNRQHDVCRFIRRLGPVYATNPAYADNLIRLIEQYHLRDLDLPGSVIAQIDPASQPQPVDVPQPEFVPAELCEQPEQSDKCDA
jgi:flagellum-specific peptidoglycan hydrolase FlgJ